MKFAEKLKTIHNKLFIKGQFVDSKAGNTFEVINPADESVIGTAVAKNFPTLPISPTPFRRLK